MTDQDTYRYLPVLQDVVRAYNNRKHRSIGVAPNMVSYRNERVVWQKQYGNVKRVTSSDSYNIGDIVRIAKVAPLFRKSHLPAFTAELFTIHKKLKTVPITYTLRDQRDEVLLGIFYPQELSLVK